MEEVQETQDFHPQDEEDLIIVKYKGTNNQKMKKKEILRVRESPFITFIDG